MFINTISHYVPEQRVPNEYFKNLNGLDDEWIFDRTGIRTRSKAGKGENANTMAVKAVALAIKKLPFDIKEVDLIIGASYTPYDTVATALQVARVRLVHFALAHQRDQPAPISPRIIAHYY